MAGRTSYQNQRLALALVLIVAVGLFLGRLLEKGAGVVGDKERVLQLADALEQCATHEQYLALLEKHYPPGSLLWQSPAMRTAAERTSAPADLERLPDGRLRVVVPAMRSDRLLERSSYVYVPAALTDNRGRGWRLVDVQLNSRKADMVFEYYYRAPAKESLGPAPPFHFFMGRRRWALP